jgi:MFS family permease
MLAILIVILAFNFMDRFALGVVLQDIKTDLKLSDTQLGLLSGLAFALFYSVMGIPIARWADRGNRVTIISVTTALWSAMVALCGMATSFIQLLAIRIGVAVGEAGCIPPAHSLIADHFARDERPRAVALYMLGAPLSLIGGYFLAGWLNELYGWRAMFVMLGLPGLAVAALAWLVLREPRREIRMMTAVQASAAAPSPREVCVALWANKTFRHLLFSFSIMSFFGYGILQWQPTFFIRSYGLQTGELGTWFAGVNGLGALVGTYWGGELATRYAARDESLQLKAMSFIYAGFGILSFCSYLAPNYYLAFGLMGLGTLGGAAANGPLFATIQTLVPDRMRAMSIAIVYLFANLIGMGLGPLAAGVLSDALRPLFGEESLRYALLALSPGYLWAAWHLAQGSRTVTHDLAEVY